MAKSGGRRYGLLNNIVLDIRKRIKALSARRGQYIAIRVNVLNMSLNYHFAGKNVAFFP